MISSSPQHSCSWVDLEASERIREYFTELRRPLTVSGYFHYFIREINDVNYSILCLLLHSKTRYNSTEPTSLVICGIPFVVETSLTRKWLIKQPGFNIYNHPELTLFLYARSRVFRLDILAWFDKIYNSQSKSAWLNSWLTDLTVVVLW